jgi:hypothetical protein
MKKSTIIIASVIGALALGGVTLAVISKRKKDSGSSGTDTVKCKGEDCENKKVTVPAQAASQIGKQIMSLDNYVIVRSKPKLDGTCYGCTDLLDNCVKCTGNVISDIWEEELGTVIDATKGDQGYIWYKVSLKTPIDGIESGWVREDVVSFK